MASRAAQSAAVHAFDDHYRKAQTGNLNAADQATPSRRNGNAISRIVRLLPVMQQLFELEALPFLEKPTIRKKQPAITQHQDSAESEYPLA